MSIRTDFPMTNEAAPGGRSDGWEYVTRFSGSSLEASYEMLRVFLVEEGYGDLPIPASVADLLLFRAPKRERQFRIFEDYGYVHNPIKILFPMTSQRPRTLELRLYNEQSPQHLLRFYGLLKAEQETAIPDASL